MISTILLILASFARGGPVPELWPKENPQCVVRAAPRIQPWTLPRLDRDHTWKSDNSAVGNTFRWNAGLRPQWQFDLKKKNASLEDVFKLIATTPFGASKLEYFAPLYQSGKIKIVFASEVELKAIAPTAGAGYNHATRTISINRDQELGILALYFIHEMEHALHFERTAEALQHQAQKERLELDRVVRDVSDEAKNLSRDAMISRFKTERRSYNAMAQFLKELKDEAPCAGPYFEVAGESPWRSDSEIIHQHKFDARILEEAGVVQMTDKK